jgi:predicted Fe-S protein YdhL (DUF1289 family)
MEDDKALTVPSPCIRQCCLSDDDYCIGCSRHLTEITQWRHYSEQQKSQVIKLCQQGYASRGKPFSIDLTNLPVKR